MILGIGKRARVLGMNVFVYSRPRAMVRAGFLLGLLVFVLWVVGH